MRPHRHLSLALLFFPFFFFAPVPPAGTRNIRPFLFPHSNKATLPLPLLTISPSPFPGKVASIPAFDLVTFVTCIQLPRRSFPLHKNPPPPNTLAYCRWHYFRTLTASYITTYHTALPHHISYISPLAVNHSPLKLEILLLFLAYRVSSPRYLSFGDYIANTRAKGVTRQKLLLPSPVLSPTSRDLSRPVLHSFPISRPRPSIYLPTHLFL